MQPKEIIAQGYDQMGARYTRWASTVRKDERTRYTHVLEENLSPGARLLELGCGSGVPTTRRLAKRFDVIGVDISKKQVLRARRNIPNATFVCADMVQLELPPASFDGIAAFYAITHVHHQPPTG